MDMRSLSASLWLVIAFALGGCNETTEQRSAKQEAEWRHKDRLEDKKLAYQAQENERQRAYDLRIRQIAEEARLKDSQDSRRVWSQVATFSSGALALVLSIGAAAAAIAFIGRQRYLRDFRIEEVRAEQARKQLLAKEVLANWAKLSADQQDRFLLANAGASAGIAS